MTDQDPIEPPAPEPAPSDTPPEPAPEPAPDRATEIQAMREEIYSLQSKLDELQDRLYAVDPPTPYVPPEALESPSSTDTPASHGYQPPPPPLLEKPELTSVRLRELADLVDELVRFHDFQQNILHCWPKHPEVVEELDLLLQTKEAWRYDAANMLYWRQYNVERCGERVKRFLRRCRAAHTDRASTWATADYRAAVTAQIEELEPPPVLPDPPPPPAESDGPAPNGGAGSTDDLR